MCDSQLHKHLRVNHIEPDKKISVKILSWTIMGLSGWQTFRTSQVVLVGKDLKVAFEEIGSEIRKN